MLGPDGPRRERKLLRDLGDLCERSLIEAFAEAQESTERALVGDQRSLQLRRKREPGDRLLAIGDLDDPGEQADLEYLLAVNRESVDGE